MSTIIGPFLIIFSIFYGGFIGSIVFPIFNIDSLFIGPIITFIFHILCFLGIIKIYSIDKFSKKLLVFLIIGFGIIIINLVLLVVTGRITDFVA
ncbi:MAG: hypothetical protein CSA18_04780 [Deltaproteobacteria bacterium]|nr:MAG: hypothetical protein CSA18_04780 [Deltaproteobacteria bacterium]